MNHAHAGFIRHSLLFLLLGAILSGFGCAGRRATASRADETGAVEHVERAHRTGDDPLVADPRAGGDWEIIGSSAEGRPVRARTLGRGSRRVALIAGIHGNEGEGLAHVEELVRLLDAIEASVRLIEDVNPDGTAFGTRHTASDVDPNRNWPASNFSPSRKRGARPLSEPEVAAAHADLVRFDPELVIVLHSAPDGPYVNFDGPARELAMLFAREAGVLWHVVTEMGYATPGSLGTWMGVDRGVPTLTVELQRDEPGPRNGAALARAIPAVIEAFAATRSRTRESDPDPR